MSSRFDIRPTPIADLLVLRRKPIGDSRGFLERLYCANDLSNLIGPRSILQINRTFTSLRGTLRGLHYQHPPHAEMKLVTCLRGEVLDIALDLRPDSPTFGKWHAEKLGAEHGLTLAIPEGFAHGFQTLTEDCEMLYFHTARHHPPAEAGIDPLDPALAIPWPLPAAEMSERDRSHPRLSSFKP